MYVDVKSTVIDTKEESPLSANFIYIINFMMSFRKKTPRPGWSVRPKFSLSLLVPSIIQ